MFDLNLSQTYHTAFWRTSEVGDFRGLILDMVFRCSACVSRSALQKDYCKNLEKYTIKQQPRGLF